MPQWDAARLSQDHYPGPGVQIPVLYGDLDTNGHLNNVALGRFFEHARASALFGTGFWEVIAGLGGTSVVARVAIDYLLEVQLGQQLVVRTRLARRGTSSAVLEQAAWRESECIGLAEVVFVHVRPDGPAPWPTEAMDRLGPLLFTPPTA